MRVLPGAIALALCAAARLTAQQAQLLPAAAQVERTYVEFNSVMMDSTFKIYGPSVSNPEKAVTTGTAFLIGRPNSFSADHVNYVLVTAAHVLKGVSGDYLDMVLRIRGDDDSYKRQLVRLEIRRSGKPAWIEHPRADVAVMYSFLPTNVAKQLMNLSFLATEDDFRKYEVHPGDEVLTAGYPYGIEANELGFPILRSGRIASYPLLPFSPTRGFLVDFAVFGGNSGGPVYVDYVNRVYNNMVHMGERVMRVVGLVSQQLVRENERLGVAGVVPAVYIREAIELLPTAPPLTTK